LGKTEKIVEVENVDNLDFLNVITKDPNYQESVESYTKREKEIVKYAIGETVDNMVKHSLRDPEVLNDIHADVASKLSVTKIDHGTYDEMQITAENFFKNAEVNETG